MDETTVVVTGASRGLGAAVARAFGEAGAFVMCGARDDGGLAAIAEAVADAGGRAEYLRTDARDEFDVERLMERAARADGAIDAVVPCAAVFHGGPGASPLQEVSYVAFDDAVRTNLRGVFTAVREAVPHLAPDARVLVPSGSVARESTAGMGAYAVSKAGAEAVARGFAADLEATVGVVDPGLVATDLTGGEGRDPDDVAPLFVWAADAAAAADVNGQVVDLAAWKQATR